MYFLQEGQTDWGIMGKTFFVGNVTCVVFFRKMAHLLPYLRRRKGNVMNISATGDRLNILITSSYSVANDWMSFAAWYSIYRNLPDAETALLCARNFSEGQMAFDWPYRCGIKFFQHENVGVKLGCPHISKLYATYVALKEEFVQQPLLVVDADVMAVRSLSKETVNFLNDPSVTYAASPPVWFFKEQPLERFVDTLNRYGDHLHKDKTDSQKVQLMLNDVMGEPELVSNLCCDVRSQHQASFVHCNERCGRYDKKEWMRARTFPPFKLTEEISKGGLHSANEQLVIKLWQRMPGIYNSVV
jgi:hypothetical protein